MTDDTQAQRLTDADPNDLPVGSVIDVRHTDGTWALMFHQPDGRWSCARGPAAHTHTLAPDEDWRRPLAARSVRDDPTLREREPDDREALARALMLADGITPRGIEFVRDDARTHHFWRQGFARADAVLAAGFRRVALAEHAPADDPTRQAAAQHEGTAGVERNDLMDRAVAAACTCTERFRKVFTPFQHHGTCRGPAVARVFGERE